MSKQKDFEELYEAYWKYVYKYEVGYPEDFKPEKYHHHVNKQDFKERLVEDGMIIKVSDGY